MVNRRTSTIPMTYGTMTTRAMSWKTKKVSYKVRHVLSLDTVSYRPSRTRQKAWNGYMNRSALFSQMLHHTPNYAPRIALPCAREKIVLIWATPREPNRGCLHLSVPYSHCRRNLWLFWARDLLSYPFCHESVRALLFPPDMSATCKMTNHYHGTKHQPKHMVVPQLLTKSTSRHAHTSGRHNLMAFNGPIDNTLTTKTVSKSTANKKISENEN